MPKRISQEKTTKNNKPILKVKSGNVSASVFVNNVKKGDDEFEFYNVNLQKSYKPKGSEEWEHQSISLQLDREVMKAIMCLQTVMSEHSVKIIE